jgi:hypothetical protein
MIHNLERSLENKMRCEWDKKNGISPVNMRDGDAVKRSLQMYGMVVLEPGRALADVCKQSHDFSCHVFWSRILQNFIKLL